MELSGLLLLFWLTFYFSSSPPLPPFSHPPPLILRGSLLHAGVDFLLDVHGDEELPHVFVAGSDGIPRWAERWKVWRLVMHAEDQH